MPGPRRRPLVAACWTAVVVLALLAFRVGSAGKPVAEAWVELPLPPTPMQTPVHVVVRRAVPAPGAADPGETWHVARVANGPDGALGFWPPDAGRVDALLRKLLRRRSELWLPTEEVVWTADGRCWGRIVDSDGLADRVAADPRRAEAPGGGALLPGVLSGRVWDEALASARTPR